MKWRAVLPTTFILLFYFSLLHGQTVDLVPFATGLTQPIDMARLGSASTDLYIAQRPGTIQRVDEDGDLASGLFLDITDRVNDNGGEQGLLGIIFHPQYPDSPYLYVNYTGIDNGQSHSFISRFDVLSADEADENSEEVLLTYFQPFQNHNGGDLEFDAQGHLLIASGDGGSGGDPQDHGQDTMSFLGKILRIDVDGGQPYAIPPDNPFAGVPGATEEIWAYGLRNPWRIDFDPVTGHVYLGDVGQNAWEEIDRITGLDPDPNFGWRCYEGWQPFNLTGCDGVDTIAPLFVYPQAPGTCGGSITGGAVYRGSDMPSLSGKYIFADYCKGWLGAMNLTTKQVDTIWQPSGRRISTFGTDHNGELYACDIVQGTIYRLEEIPSVRAGYIFTMDLDGDQSGTPSLATGYGIGVYDSVEMRLTVSGQFTELIGDVTVAHVHIGPAGVNGGIVFPLQITDYGTDSIGFFGSGILTTNEANALLVDGLYVNIHSTSYPPGEIRGQILLVNCPQDYLAHAPLLPPGVIPVESATLLGNLNNNRNLILLYSDEAEIVGGFSMEVGSSLEVRLHHCD